MVRMVDIGDIGNAIDEGVQQAEETAEDIAESEPVQDAVEEAQQEEQQRTTDNRRPGARTIRYELQDMAREAEQDQQQQQEQQQQELSGREQRLQRVAEQTPEPAPEPSQDTSSGGGTTRTFEGVDSGGTDRQQASPSDGPPVFGGTGEQPEQRDTQDENVVSGGQTGQRVGVDETQPQPEQQDTQTRTGQTGQPVVGSQEDSDFGQSTGLDDIGGEVAERGQQFAKTAAEEVTPSARMTLDEAGTQIRNLREQEFAQRAEEGVESITSGELPSGEEVGGLVFQAGELTERGITEGGRSLGQGIDYGVDVAQFGAETVAQGDIGEATTRLETASEDIREGDIGQGFESLSGQDSQILGEEVGEIPGNIAEGAIAGVGMGAGSAIRAPVTISADITGDVPERADQTPSEATGAFGQVQQLGKSQVRMFEERPVSTAALFALPAAEGVASGVRGFRSTRGTSETISLESITSERGVQGELPQFRTSMDAPTSRAVREVRTRAAEQPSKVQELTGSEQVLWHSTPEAFPREFAAQAGQSELPGLFTSPDASPLRLENVRGAAESPSLRERITPSRPDLSTQPDRLAGFEGSRIEGMPESARGSGRIREGGEFVPDPSTSGARFLREQADPGTAQVRPTGSRTTELEAIFPPESQFRQTGRVAVETPGGEKIPADIFRTQRGTRTGEARTGTTGSEISRTYSTDISTGRPGFTTFDYTTGFGGLGDRGASTDGTTETRTSTTETTTQTGGGFDLGGTVDRLQSGVSDVGSSFLGELGDFRQGTTPGRSDTGGTDTTGTDTTDTTGGTSTDRDGRSPDTFDPFRPTDPTPDDGTDRTPTDPTPRDPFRPSEPPERTPTEPPSEPPSSPPSSPPSGQPTRQPSYPFGQPTTQVPQGTYRKRTDDDDDDEKDPLPSVGPAGQEFQNPVASGSAFLFGTGLGSASDQEATAANVLPGGPGTPSEGVLSGAVEPPELFEGAFIND